MAPLPHGQLLSTCAERPHRFNITEFTSTQIKLAQMQEVADAIPVSQLERDQCRETR